MHFGGIQPFRLIVQWYVAPLAIFWGIWLFIRFIFIFSIIFPNQICRINAKFWMNYSHTFQKRWKHSANLKRFYDDKKTINRFQCFDHASIHVWHDRDFISLLFDAFQLFMNAGMTLALRPWRLHNELKHDNQSANFHSKEEKEERRRRKKRLDWIARIAVGVTIQYTLDLFF